MILRRAFVCFCFKVVAPSSIEKQKRMMCLQAPITKTKVNKARDIKLTNRPCIFRSEKGYKTSVFFISTIFYGGWQPKKIQNYLHINCIPCLSDFIVKKIDFRDPG